jgi:hypothetical protein
MTISTLRRLVTFICALSIAGMIVMSIKDNIGGAMTSGIVGAIAMLCLITGNAIHLGTNGGGAQEALGAELEARLAELVAAGADEDAARSAIGKAIRFGEGEAMRRTEAARRKDERKGRRTNYRDRRAGRRTLS